METGIVGEQIRLYYHQDLQGTVDYLTSPVSQKVESWTHYNEWGEITHNAVVKCGYREFDLVKNYTGHEYDAVLNLYYAKARMYDAENRHFTSVDPILDASRYEIAEYVTNPRDLVQYLYVQNNPLIFVDPLGLDYIYTIDGREVYVKETNNGYYVPIRELVEVYGGQFPTWNKTHGSTLTAALQGKSGNVNIRLDAAAGTLTFSSKYHDTQVVYLNTASNIPANTLQHHLMINENNTNMMDIRYFALIMCQFGFENKLTQQQAQYVSSLDDTTTEAALILNGWLPVYSSPSHSGGRDVFIPESREEFKAFLKSKYGTLESIAPENVGNSETKINMWAPQDLIDHVRTDGPGGTFYDERYPDRIYVAVGPKVQNENYVLGNSFSAEEAKYGVFLDIELTNLNTSEVYYIYAILGDTKFHTGAGQLPAINGHSYWANGEGIYQTGFTVDEGIFAPGYEDSSVVEILTRGGLDLAPNGDDPNDPTKIPTYTITRIIIYDSWGVYNP